MKKAFIIKLKQQDQLFNIDLSIYSANIDYKSILRLLTRDKHKNFIKAAVTHKGAFNLISYYLKSSVNACFDLHNHYRYCYKEIGPVGIEILTMAIVESIESIVFTYTEPLMFDLNNLKIQ